MSDPVSASQRVAAIYQELQGDRSYIPFWAGAEMRIGLALHADPTATRLLDGGQDHPFPPVQRFLQAQGPDQRLFLADSLVQEVARQERLTPRPFLRHLSGLEFGGAFHAGYRDHVTHSVRVYLLGAWIFRNCRSLRVDMGFQGTDAEFARFLETWRITALWHDVGYLFENERPAERMAAFQRLREYRQTLFERLDAERDRLPPLPDDVRLLIEKTHARSPAPLHDVHDLYTLPGDLFGEQATDAFALLDGPHGPRGGLSRGVRGYFDLCRTAEVSKGRPPFLDHGVMGALMLLRAAAETERFLAVARDQSRPHEPQWADHFQKEWTAFRGKAERIREAASAIAFHNVSRDAHRKPGVVRLPDTPLVGDDFAIAPCEDPFAFLLRLADTLQDWDRRYFRSAIAPGEELRVPRVAQDIDVQVTDDRIEVVVTSQGGAADDKYRAEFSDLRTCDGHPLWEGPTHAPRRPPVFTLTFADAPRLMVMRTRAGADRGRVEDGKRRTLERLKDLPRTIADALSRIRVVAEGGRIGAPQVEVDLTGALDRLVELGVPATDARRWLETLWLEIAHESSTQPSDWLLVPAEQEESVSD